MNKYNEGKIYKIINPDLPNIIYIGSTIRTLKERYALHKFESKKFNNSSKILFTVGEPEIILLEAYPCECRKQLIMKEQEYINNIGCINNRNSFISDEEKKEYYQKNKEIIKKNNKNYYQKNKEQLKEQQKEYYKQNNEIIIKKNKEYYNKNKEIIHEKKQEYYQKYKEIINEKRVIKITCACGSIFRKSDKSQHEKTKKHINYIKE